MKNILKLRLITLIAIMLTSISINSSPEMKRKFIPEDKICGPKGCEKSFKDILKLAKNGSPRAKMITGLLYLNGIGTEKNEERAGKYLLAAARAGIDIAQYAMGIIYLNENIFEYDQEEGNYWLNKSANAGYEPAIKTIKQNNKLAYREKTKSREEYVSTNQDDGHIIVTREYLTIDDWADLY